MNKPSLAAGALALTLSLGLAAGMPAVAADSTTQASAVAQATSAPGLHNAMRALWHEHIVQTRAYAQAVHAADRAAAEQAVDGAVANAKQIADAVAGFYGAPAGEQMLGLLAGHWQGVKDLTDATEAADKAAVGAAGDELQSNADAIATFLSGANPNLPHDAVYGLMMAHIGFHAAQIKEIAGNDTAAEAQTWVGMQKHMDSFSDGLSDAIAAQFPDQAQ